MSTECYIDTVLNCPTLSLQRDDSRGPRFHSS